MSDKPAAFSEHGESDQQLQAWQPQQYCRKIEAAEVRLSRGFLRSSPARWFPGINSHWLPLFHSTVIDFKVNEIVPMLSVISESSSGLQNPGDLEPKGAWLIDEEPALLYMDSTAQNLLVQALIPNSSRYSRKIMLEYLCRRVAISLKTCWSGMEGSLLSYDSEFPVDTFRPYAWIQLRATLNSERVNFYFGLSRLLVEKLDGLWRRQFRPASASNLITRHIKPGAVTVRAEIARLSVPPQSLTAYLKSGNLIDLEIPASANLILKLAEDNWISAVAGTCEDRYVFEVTSISPPAMHVVEGATPLSIELGQITLDSSNLTEFEQAGSILESELPVSDLVSLTIRGEKVGRAKLAVFEGRLCLSIL